MKGNITFCSCFMHKRLHLLGWHKNNFNIRTNIPFDLILHFLFAIVRECFCQTQDEYGAWFYVAFVAVHFICVFRKSVKNSSDPLIHSVISFHRRLQSMQRTKKDRADYKTIYVVKDITGSCHRCIFCLISENCQAQLLERTNKNKNKRRCSWRMSESK